MSDEVLVRNCAPTLAGLKTGSLFNGRFSSKEAMVQELRVLNTKFASKGLRVIPLQCRAGKALLYLYRPACLKKDLNDREALDLLQALGYPCQAPDLCVMKLIKKLQSCSEFPHEIGLFLGYPPADVRGFMENKAENCKCVGTWKVYGDADAARKTFSKFKKCTGVYCRMLEKGSTVEQLAVAL